MCYNNMDCDFRSGLHRDKFQATVLYLLCQGKSFCLYLKTFLEVLAQIVASEKKLP